MLAAWLFRFPAITSLKSMADQHIRLVEQTNGLKNLAVDSVSGYFQFNISALGANEVAGFY
jgi:hypothetical protein